MTDVPDRLTDALADRYRIERELGQGGMATVYLAEDLKHRRMVALKVLRPELAAALGPERFLREITITAQLDHPHILPLLDSGLVAPEGAAEGRPYYVMPYVEGESLRDRLDREKQLPVDEAVQLAREVADALNYAHSRGIIHRDIKPDNILLSGGHARVADFGIARAISVAAGESLTRTGMAIGTPAYMSPEQGTGEGDLDGRSDLYALGCVTYEMLAGQPPFTGPTAQSILARHSVDAVPPLRSVRATIPVAVERAVLKALAKVPADRFATPAAFRQALDDRNEATETTALPRVLPFAHRRNLLIAVAALIVLALGIWQLMRVRANRVSPNSNLVAILPFRVEGANPELAWLREGMVDLLAIKLTGEAGMRAADPRSVLSASSRVSGSGKDLTPEAALEVARQIGAGRVIDGGIVGTHAHLTITASLVIAPGGRGAARASVEGPEDSLSAMVDRLAAQLLSLEAGVDVSRLSSITTTSVPAIRAFLAGRASFRRGENGSAIQQFVEATRLDSTFALAALEIIHVAPWVGGSRESERAVRLALAGRDRLSPSDRALLDVWTGPFPTGPVLIERWRRVTTAYPDRAETWYGLGDVFFHYGRLIGLDHYLDSAAQAFRRGWAIDSASAADSFAYERSPIFAEPLEHMVSIAAATGDTTGVRQLVSLGLAIDSVSTNGWVFRWHRALIEGDSARLAFWADSLRMPLGSIDGISVFISWLGVGLEDYERVHRLVLSRRDPRMAADLGAEIALNGGRPQETLRLRRVLDDSARFFPERMGEALYWGGDSIAGAAGARTLARLMGSPSTEFWALGWIQDVAQIATWRAAHGDLASLDTAIRLLRQPLPGPVAPGDTLFVAYNLDLNLALLEAMRSTARHRPDARKRLEEADEAARTHIAFLAESNLIVARLAEAQGDLELALRAIRRRAGGTELGFPLYLSTFLHEEGRLAALTGDTTGAIRAYQHYLALRPNPEPAVKPEVDQVRQELGRLVGEHPRP